jgi:hypothetical protein
MDPDSGSPWMKTSSGASGLIEPPRTPQVFWSVCRQPRLTLFGIGRMIPLGWLWLGGQHGCGTKVAV